METNGRQQKTTATRKSAAAQTAASQPSPQSSERESIVAPTPIFIGSQTNHRNWRLPALADMLEAGSDQEISNIQIREQVEVIEHTLDSFGAPATVVEINQGPTITQFGVEPSFIEQRSGKRTKVKVGKIAGLADDLALALAARSIRIQAPVPGKGYVGIEVPNTDKAVVSLRDVLESEEFQKINSPLRIGLGQNVAGQPRPRSP
jgi:S-DNA-T family DNA segregation ATPase FtsK/SpoIIIE